jgi:thiol-disulfide isomerase/thioredoxin
MAYAESNMMPIGTKASQFLLKDTVSGSFMTYENCRGEHGTIVMFICNHCPYVIHVNSELVKIANDYAVKGIKCIAINSNDVEKYTDDAPDKMSIVAKVLQYPFPYLFDATQEVAKAYDAACTPDIYLFDEEDRLYYRGRLDGSKPKNDLPLTGKDLRSALDDMLAHKPSPDVQYPAGGCGIKWKIS